MNTKKTTKGFTIIEVVLVLAIAGLIFLMVFVALPALQKGQRDTARKNDVSIVSTAVSNYVSANRGSYPSSSARLQSFIDGLSSNTPLTGVSMVTTYPTSNSVTVKTGQIIVVTNARCGDTGSGTAGTDGTLTGAQAVSKGLASKYVVITMLEAGSGGTTFCQES